MKKYVKVILVVIGMLILASVVFAQNIISQTNFVGTTYGNECGVFIYDEFNISIVMATDPYTITFQIKNPFPKIIEFEFVIALLDDVYRQELGDNRYLLSLSLTASGLSSNQCSITYVEQLLFVYKNQINNIEYGVYTLENQFSSRCTITDVQRTLPMLSTSAARQILNNGKCTGSITF